MDLDIRVEERQWEREKHLRHIEEGQWLPMLDADGKVLEGIVGKHGVKSEKKDGTSIGGDYIRMEPGRSFPLHEHVGDHVIYFVSGRGYVLINGEREYVTGGTLVTIPGEYPHGVGVDDSATDPLIFVAIGHPHKEVNAPDRMQHPH